jgi:DNA-directed RNA polymerase specialized sigma24 family protein
MVQLDGAAQARMVSHYLPELDIDLLPLEDSEREFFRAYFIERAGAQTMARETGLSAAGVRSRAHALKLRLRRQFHGTPACASLLNPVLQSAEI